MVLIGRLPLAFADPEPEVESGIAERCCESGGLSTVDCARGVWVSESEGEERSWASSSLVVDILLLIGGVVPVYAGFR